jgi:hypothetical protein
MCYECVLVTNVYLLKIHEVSVSSQTVCFRDLDWCGVHNSYACMLDMQNLWVVLYVRV